MKVYPDADEMYPCYTLCREKPFEGCEAFGTVAVEIPDEEVAEFERLSEEFHKWNDRIAKLIRATPGGRV